MSGVPYHAWTHRPKALGGTDPIEVAAGSALPYCWMIGGTNWSGGAVTINTLVNPATSFGDYDESFISDGADVDGPQFACNLADGRITWQGTGEYVVFAFVSFNGGATSGAKLAAELRWGTAAGSMTGFQLTSDITVDSVNNGTMGIPISASMYSGGGFPGYQSVRIRVYHSSAATQNVNTIYVHVVQLSSDISGTFAP